MIEQVLQHIQLKYAKQNGDVQMYNRLYNSSAHVQHECASVQQKSTVIKLEYTK